MTDGLKQYLPLTQGATHTTWCGHCNTHHAATDIYADPDQPPIGTTIEDCTEETP